MCLVVLGLSIRQIEAISEPKSSVQRAVEKLNKIVSDKEFRLDEFFRRGGNRRLIPKS